MSSRLLVLLLIISFILNTGFVAGKEKHFEQFGNVRKLLDQFCLNCHSHDHKEGQLDLQRFASYQHVQADLKPWQAIILQLDSHEMPPKDLPQPSEAQRKELIDWTKETLRLAAQKNSGDPGFVPLHRLSNTEYDNTIRDLTGTDLRPAKTFPADGAAGEGFTNAAEALSMSPAMMSKYIQSAKEISRHAVLLPNGFRFSTSTTKRDWTDESLAELRTFYRQFTYEGSLPLKPYIVALSDHRADLQARTMTINQVARERNLSTKYLEFLWDELNTDQPDYPMNHVIELWSEYDVDGIVDEVAKSFDRLWEYPRIGSYANKLRQKAKDPAVQTTQTLTINHDALPGQSDVTLYLESRSLSNDETIIRFTNPRFQKEDGSVLKLRDYPHFGSRYEVNLSQMYSNTTAYLNAAVEAANDSSLTNEELAKKYEINSEWLSRWITKLNVQPIVSGAKPETPGRIVVPIEMTLLDELAPNSDHQMINGWRPKGADLPIVISNASDKAEHIPGRISGHMIAAHPMPTEFVATVWKSPISGRVRISGKVAHTHPACGNGIRWWIESQMEQRSAVLQEGNIDLGKETVLTAQEIMVKEGDQILLAIAARDASHVCDLTEVAFTITEMGIEDPRVWDLAGDVANDITQGNPHPDRLGNVAVWGFVRGSTKDRQPGSEAELDSNNLLAKWRNSASSSINQAEAKIFANQLQLLLTGERPEETDAVNRKLYDHFVSFNSPLLSGLDLQKIKAQFPQQSQTTTPEKTRFGLAAEMFDGADLILSTGRIVSLRLPAAIFRDYQFVVDCRLQDEMDPTPVLFQIEMDESTEELVWDGTSPIILSDQGDARQKFFAGLEKFRGLFPPNICYPHIIPLDEVVCLKTFHREDQPLIDLFLNDDQTAELERLWEKHRFITKFPVVENEYLPLFIGFVTQDQPKSLVEFYESKRPEFQERSESFLEEFNSAAPSQLKQLEQFASRAYRRPLSESEKMRLHKLYDSLRERGVEHEEAFRSMIARVLMSPSFLLHVRQGDRTEPNMNTLPLTEWELASRLSYFLWSSIPDAKLCELATAGTLHQPEVLAAQTRRMLNDDRARALAVEFGTQWIHVRGFDAFNEKNESLFPTFDQELREAMNEEVIEFFHHLFRTNSNADEILNADYTFVNARLAQHYGIPNVQGEQLRRVDGVKQFGRGGILGFGAVQSKQAGASRTSPILRGNWVVETLLGEKLPLPPPNVPQLPEQVAATEGLTMRQINERHVNDEACATCHRRIDPFGYSLENYDAIGRLRHRDSNNLPINAHALLRNGSEFEGIEGLRKYLLNHKQHIITRLFCQRLLGYALGRATTISDQILIDEMTQRLDSGGVADAVTLIINSPQFRTLRNAEIGEQR
ncbi:DUF1592 domain-containing protein [uncultured Rubinisphaera sp.]|uniref:DUF1592 domain-containing protein n=1 Tax=uncultured Rubinisphaera sp. TaxID=1678686 RepID=UPI0030DB0C4D